MEAKNINQKEIETKVIESIALALGLEEEEVDLDANIFDDLGAESLDLLDINSRLQKAYQIRFPRDNFITKANEILGKEFLADGDGALTDRGLSMLKKRFPELVEVFGNNTKLQVSQLPKMVTPRTWIRMVNELLENQNMSADELNTKWLEEYKREFVEN